jgi:hypothetical protein
MAGSGAVTKWLPPGTLALEWKEQRVTEGRKAAPHARWVCADCFGDDPLRLALTAHASVVVANPEFADTLAILRLAREWIEPKEKGQPAGVVVMLLPSTIFDGTAVWQQFGVLGLRVVEELKVGRWAYYPEFGARKRATDSLFVFETAEHSPMAAWPIKTLAKDGRRGLRVKKGQLELSAHETREVRSDFDKQKSDGQAQKSESPGHEPRTQATTQAERRSRRLAGLQP